MALSHCFTAISFIDPCVCVCVCVQGEDKVKTIMGICLSTQHCFIVSLVAKNAPGDLQHSVPSPTTRLREQSLVEMLGLQAACAHLKLVMLGISDCSHNLKE